MTNTFKIVKIVNAYSLVINGGINDGLKLGDKMEIFEKGQEIIDPDTKEFLGCLDFIKAHVEIAEIFEKMSVCKSLKSVMPGAIAISISKLYESQPQELNVDSLDISGGYENTNDKIKVGDLVRKSL